jgi:hypothetical protein
MRHRTSELHAQIGTRTVPIPRSETRGRTRPQKIVLNSAPQSSFLCTL